MLHSGALSPSCPKTPSDGQESPLDAQDTPPDFQDKPPNAQGRPQDPPDGPPDAQDKPPTVSKTSRPPDGPPDAQDRPPTVSKTGVWCLLLATCYLLLAPCYLLILILLLLLLPVLLMLPFAVCNLTLAACCLLLSACRSRSVLQDNKGDRNASTSKDMQQCNATYSARLETTSLTEYGPSQISFATPAQAQHHILVPACASILRLLAATGRQ